MRNPKNLIYFSLVFLIFLGLKFLFESFEVNQMYFLLKPTDFVVELFTGSSSVYIENKGFYFENLNIIINKFCSGYNFWLISFLVISFLMITYLKSNVLKLLAIPVSLMIGFLFTIFTNSSRIFTLILLQKQGVFIGGFYHEGVGFFLNLFFLIVLYLLLRQLLIKIFTDEKFA